MTFRHWIRIIGIALIGFGLLCLPSIESSPQSHGSGFTILSDTGFLLWIAIILIVPTWLLIVRPCKEMIVRKRERDDYANHLTNR